MHEEAAKEYEARL